MHLAIYQNIFVTAAEYWFTLLLKNPPPDFTRLHLHNTLHWYLSNASISIYLTNTPINVNRSIISHNL